MRGKPHNDCGDYRIWRYADDGSENSPFIPNFVVGIVILTLILYLKIMRIRNKKTRQDLSRQTYLTRNKLKFPETPPLYHLQVIWSYARSRFKFWF